MSAVSHQPIRRAGVIGWPVGHSRSPLIHGFWIEKYGIAGAYDRYGVPPETIDDFLHQFGGNGLIGANVTIPHKGAAFLAADWRDETAVALGVANTLWLDQEGRLCAGNTDPYGFLANLDDRAPGWDRALSVAVVLGAGGAARSIVYGLLSRKAVKVIVVNRTIERARQLADRYGAPVDAADWSALPGVLSNASLLVNSTSLGMTGQPPLQVDLSPLPAHALVADIVYAPLQTELLRSADARGLKTVDGLGMLLHQAVPGFERWFGVRPRVTEELRALVIADLDHHA